MTDSLAAVFAQGVTTDDVAALRGLLHPEIDFRGITPGKVWEADGPEDVHIAMGRATEAAIHLTPGGIGLAGLAHQVV